QSPPERHSFDHAPRIASPLGDCFTLPKSLPEPIVSLVVGIYYWRNKPAIIGTIGTVIINAIDLQPLSPSNLCPSLILDHTAPAAAQRGATFTLDHTGPSIHNLVIEIAGPG